MVKKLGRPKKIQIVEKEPIPDDVEIDESDEEMEETETGSGNDAQVQRLTGVVEDLARMNIQMGSMILVLNDQLTLIMNGLNCLSENQMEIAKFFTPEPPDNAEMYKSVINPEHIEQLRISVKQEAKDGGKKD